jgi:hypothetical protein
MAARKKNKAKKTSTAAKSRRTPAKKAKKAKAKKPAKRGAGKARASAKRTTKAAKAPAKKARKAPAKKKKQPVGEGDYAASRKFLKDQSGFVERNRAKIPAMGQAAEKDLQGPEGNALREAEAAAAARSRDTF